MVAILPENATIQKKESDVERWENVIKLNESIIAKISNVMLQECNTEELLDFYDCDEINNI